LAIIAVMLLQITWDANPELINLFGNFSLRWYSLLFVTGLILGYVVVSKIFVNEGITRNKVDQLTLLVFIGTVFGARLGHCLFYEPEYYLQHPLEMILPFKFDGGIEFTGFAGLASHGGAIGVIIAIVYWSIRNKQPLIPILDKVAVGVPLVGFFIRLGNFFNSEIIGKPTGGDYGIIFKKIDNVARHPGQLYEAISYIILFVIVFLLYKKDALRNKRGFIFGLMFAGIFIARFVIEFSKIEQVAFEQGMTLNMGQWLSIPFIIVGLIFMFRPQKKVVTG